MTVNFNTRLSDDGEKLFGGQRVFSTEERERLYQDLLADFFEQLLLFDKISIKVERDNWPLAILIHELGLDLTQECIQDGTIEIILWTQQLFITSGENGKTDDLSLGGIPPLHAGRMTSPRHSDPEESIKQVFKTISHQYSKEEKKRFIQRVAYRIQGDDHNLTDRTKSLILDAYKANHLADIGLPYDRDPDRLSYEQRRRLLLLAGDIIDVSYMASKNYCSMNKYNSTLIAESTLKNIGKSLRMSGGMEEIAKLEKMPDLRNIFREQKIDFRSAVKFRNKATAMKFREWLATATSNQEAEYITKLYVDELVNRSGYFDTVKSKLVKTFFVTTVGAGVGAIVAGQAGAVFGAAAGKAVDIVTDFSIGSFDALFLDRILKGWTPRFFVDELRKIISDNEEN